MRHLVLLLATAAACARPAPPPPIANTVSANTCDAIAPAIARTQPAVTGRSLALEVAYRTAFDRACRRDGWSARAIACVVDHGAEACRRALPAADRARLDTAQIEAQRAIAGAL